MIDVLKQKNKGNLNERRGRAFR
ncbi:MAG TPA: hypothetical protein VJ202_03790 [Thermodesulfobacteriota bacterium]|nr:hypothetical protein [Thermodesulfobacteriota bacterium]